MRWRITHTNVRATARSKAAPSSKQCWRNRRNTMEHAHAHPHGAPAEAQCHPHPHAHGHGHGARTSLAGLTTSATLHCLTGCAIGELAGLLIGVSLGLDPWTTMALATVLGFVSGYALGLRPL